MLTMLTQKLDTGKRLWQFSGVAVVVWMAVVVVGLFVPAVQRAQPLAQLIIEGVWAALCLWVLLANARRSYQFAVLLAAGVAVALSVATAWFGVVDILLISYGW